MKKDENDNYIYGDWLIERVGGFITARHYWAHNEKLDVHFWQMKLSEVRKVIDSEKFRDLDKLYYRSLY